MEHFWEAVGIMRFMIKRALLFSCAVIVFGGCSRNTAFEYFTKLDTSQERAVTHLRKVTIRENSAIQALISVMYLNPVKPELYQNQHYFLIALYDVKSGPLEAFRVMMNGAEPAGMAELDDNCTLKALMPLNNPWNRYYEVVFRHSKDENLTLTFETGPSSKEAVTYHTAQ